MPQMRRCTNCNKTIRIPDSAAGKHVRCPACRTEFAVAKSPVLEAAGVQRSEVRSQRSEVRGQESGVRSQGSGVRSPESGVRDQKSEVRGQKSEVGSTGEPMPVAAKEKPRTPAIST